MLIPVYFVQFYGFTSNVPKTYNEKLLYELDYNFNTPETTHLIDGRLKLLGQVRISRRHLVSGGNATVGGARTSETAGTNDEDRHLCICCYLIIVTFQNIYVFVVT